MFGFVVCLRFTEFPAVPTKPLSSDSSSTQQRKGTIPSIVVVDSEGISLGKKLWTKVCLI
jgi:hypothetical protein